MKIVIYQVLPRLFGNKGRKASHRAKGNTQKNAIHSPNESMDLEVWENGIVAVTEFYKTLPLTSNL